MVATLHYLAELSIASKYCARSGDIPAAVASTAKKVIGMKIPKVSKQMPRMRASIPTSWKGWSSSSFVGGCGFGGFKDLIVRFAMISRNWMRNAAARSVHP